MPKADVVDLSSSDTEALLDSLSISPARDSLVSRPRTALHRKDLRDGCQCMVRDVVCTIGKRKAGGCMRINASSQGVPEHCETR
jgi:hypothetical protein